MPNAIKMFDQIKSHNYSDLTLGFRMIDNMGHLGGEAEAINQGMRFAYKRPSITLSEEELRSYCGTYKDGTYIREIIMRDGELHLVREGSSNGEKIQVINRSQFSILGSYFDFHFNRNDKGDVISFYNQLDVDSSRSRTAIKIK